MKDRQKKSRREGAGLPPLDPETQAALQQQVARLKTALAAGEPQKALLELVDTRSEDPGWDLHLIEQLTRLRHEAIPSLLAALFGPSPDKRRRKALKRALHLLRTRGVPVSPDLLPREAPLQALPAATTAPVLNAHLSPIYRDGERYVILQGPREIMGGNLLIARVSDQTGLKECHLAVLARKQQQHFWEDLKKEGFEDWAVCPPAYALRLLEEGLSLTPAGVSAREEYLAVREALWRHLGRPEEAPALESLLPPLDPAKPNPNQEELRRLAADRLFFPWWPLLGEMDPWLDKLAEVQKSPLILAEHQKRQREEDLLAAAARAFYPPETRPAWGRRLLEMALFLHLSGRTSEAQVLQAAARDLLSGEQSPLQGENPFLLEMTRLALARAWEHTREEASLSDASPLLTPASLPFLIRR